MKILNLITGHEGLKVHSVIVSISVIKELILACESRTASSSKVSVGSIDLFWLSCNRFGNGEGPLLLTLSSMLSFSGEKILSMPSLPANHDNNC
jgi:hypothetical protein